MFDKYLRDREMRGQPRWRRRLPFWLILAAGSFSLFVPPLIGPYVLVVAYYLAGRSERLRAAVLTAEGEVPRTMVAGYGLLGLVLAAVLMFELTPAESSDNAWFVMIVPVYWLGMTSPVLVTAAVLPRHDQRERALVMGMVAFVLLGVITIGFLLATIILGPERDLLGNEFRRQIALAEAISIAMLLVVPISVRRRAARAY